MIGRSRLLPLRSTPIAALVLCICLRSAQGFDVADALARHRRHRAGVQRLEASDGGAKRQPNDAFGRRQGATAPLHDADNSATPPRATIVLWLDESFWGHPGVYDCGAGTCELTRDRTRLHEPGTHAVWFYGPNIADTVDAVAADLATAGAANAADAKKEKKKKEKKMMMFFLDMTVIERELLAM